MPTTSALLLDCRVTNQARQVVRAFRAVRPDDDDLVIRGCFLVRTFGQAFDVHFRGEGSVFGVRRVGVEVRILGRSTFLLVGSTIGGPL